MALGGESGRGMTCWNCWTALSGCDEERGRGVICWVALGGERGRGMSCWTCWAALGGCDEVRGRGVTCWAALGGCDEECGAPNVTKIRARRYVIYPVILRHGPRNITQSALQCHQRVTSSYCGVWTSRCAVTP